VNDFINWLDRELVNGAARRRPERTFSRRAAVGALARARGGAGALIATVGAATAIVVAVGTLILVGGHARPRSTVAGSSRQQLIDILGVLRRPQTKSDLDPQLFAMLKRIDQGAPGQLDLEGAPDLPLIRLATITPWGEKVFLVPIKPLTASQLRAALRQFPHAFRRRLPSFLLQRAHQETLGVYTINRGGPQYGGGGGLTAATIEAGHGSDGTQGAYPSTGGGGYTRMIIVVPDGVARVTLVLPRQGSRIGPGTPLYKHPLRVTTDVHGNVAAFQINRQCCTGRIATTWYGTGGQVLKQLGNAAATNRIVHTPKPGPETPLSRAAERNPSTPNRVWVTPRTGRPSTQFMVHFRVLLTDAFYRYTFTGTRCPQMQTGGSGGIGGGLQDIRGQIWSGRLFPVPGERLCAGTYRVSATVTSLGIGRPLKHPDRSFGTVAFTVKP
jgi:hypothetical protein